MPQPVAHARSDATSVAALNDTVAALNDSKHSHQGEDASCGASHPSCAALRAPSGGDAHHAGDAGDAHHAQAAAEKAETSLLRHHLTGVLVLLPWCAVGDLFAIG